MHPIFNSRSGPLLYLLTWIPLGILFGFVLSVSAQLRQGETALIAAPLVLALAFLCLTAWYTCRSLPLRSTPPWRILATQVVLAMCVSTAVVLLARVLVAGLNNLSPGISARFHGALPVLAVMILLIYLLSVALHYVLLAVESSRQAELLSREAELKALKAQVNPHFLFNSLNSISALTALDPARARDMCIRLSDFLRNSLRLGERVTVPFSEELALTKTYLEVEQVRFGSRLRVSQDFDDLCSNCEVPPLLVQPLIENAIKHGIATLVDGGEISIRGRRLHKFISVMIENPFDPEAPETRRNGFGLISVRNRLQARYGNAARLEIQVDKNRYRVALTLPCEGCPEQME